MKNDRKNGNTDLSRNGFVLSETEEEVEIMNNAEKPQLTIPRVTSSVFCSDNDGAMF